MDNESTDTASPLAVITATRPLLAPSEAISENGICSVVVLGELFTMTLFLQNLMVTDPVNPVPLMVKVSLVLSVSVKVENPVIDGGVVVSIVSEVAPLIAIVEPLPTSPVGWLLAKSMK